MKESLFPLIILLSIALLTGSALASPATVCQVWTTDDVDDPKVEYDVDETVYVHWNGDGEVDIIVYAPDGMTIDQEWKNQQSSGVRSFVPSHGSGIYTIECTGGTTRAIAVGTFQVHVVPEIPFGTVLVLCVMLASFAIKRALRP
ncbi:MAG: hypothetical protein ACE5NN_00475 [Candidatus Bathyarchaeia archaeon]